MFAVLRHWPHAGTPHYKSRHHAICAMRFLAAAGSAPTVLRTGAFTPRLPLLSLPLRRGRTAGNMLGAARSVSAAAQSRIGSGGAAAEARTVQSGEIHVIPGPMFAGKIGGGGAVAEARTVQSGEIHVIIGPMFAGKTTALLRRVQAEAGSGRRVALVKSDKDNRYGLDSVVTHDGTKMACWALSELSSFHDKLGIEAYDKVDVIGIDEAQFFDDLYDFCCKAADHDGKIVVVAGLDGDYKRKKFGSVLDIVPLADSVTKLTAQCELCGRRAFFTLRKTQETKTELIGGADVYIPVCRQHYMDGQVVIEATRVVLGLDRATVTAQALK